MSTMSDATALRHDASEVLHAIRGVVQRLRSAPLTADAKVLSRFVKNPPAPRHMLALMRVVSAEGMSVSDLAEALGISLATASQIVTDLENDQLVQRYHDPADRRRTLLRVSDERREAVGALVANRLRPVQQALDRMKPAEQRALLRGLHLIAEELDTLESDQS